MTRSLALASLLLTIGLIGCRPDLKRIADEHVTANLLESHEKRAAIPFFEEQGRLFDKDESTDVDQQVVLRILKQFLELARTEQWVLLHPEAQNRALAVLVALPKDAQTVDRMADIVQAADDTFSGFIVQQWGHDWLMFNLIDQQAYEYLKKNNPNFDKQR